MTNGLNSSKAGWDEGLLHVVRLLYQSFLDKCDAVERESLYQTVLEDVESARTGPLGLIPFIQMEPNRRIASSSAREYLLNYRADPENSLEGVRSVVDMIVNGPVGNRGAVFAALVLLGDRQIHSVARAVRNDLEVDDIREFSYTHVDHLIAATIEFCLEWLLRLNRPDSYESFRLVASALNLMLVHDRTGTVIDVKYDLGPSGFRRRPTILRTREFEDYLQEVLPVMEYIASRGHSAIMNNVMDMWKRYAEEARWLREGSRQRPV